MRYPLVGLALGLALAATQCAAQAPAPKSPLPARKSGLWEVTLGSSAPGPRQGQTLLQCTSAGAEPVMLMAIVPAQENCRKVKVERRAKGYGIQTECYMHGNRVEARMELAGDLQSAYKGSFSVNPPPAPGAAPAVFEGRWLGACKPGQRPGDMVLPNGITVNVVADRQRAEAVQEREDHGHAH